MNKASVKRLQKEIRMLELDPPHGICAWPETEGVLTSLRAQICGPDESPYKGGIFELVVNIPDRYPFEPPKLRFLTPIYHPNIDSGGRICLDTLNMPPKGAWTPSLSICTVLSTIGLLMSQPNPDDGLMQDITNQFKKNFNLYLATARKWTARHAIHSLSSSHIKLHSLAAASSTSTFSQSSSSSSTASSSSLTRTDNSSALFHPARKAQSINNSQSNFREKSATPENIDSHAFSFDSNVDESKPKRRKIEAVSENNSQIAKPKPSQAVNIEVASQDDEDEEDFQGISDSD